jgi:hypothetical protein
MPDARALHEWCRRCAPAGGDCIHVPAGGDRSIILEQRRAAARLRKLVAVFDEEPVGALAALPVEFHPHKHPAPLQALAVKSDF